MKIAKLLHNPKAGDEAHDKDALLSEIKSAGFKCRYSSTKDSNWGEFQKDIDFIIVAAGDGTVRNLIKKLVEKNLPLNSFPIALLPLGTANNISKTLHIEGDIKQIIQSWKAWKLKNYDIGKVWNAGDASFFLESFGFGLFPYLMQEMKKVDQAPDASPEDNIKTALRVLHQISLSYEPKDCKLTIDGKDHSGKFLLVEIMNIRSIGPNLFLSPDGDPCDGFMEVVLLPVEDKEKFAAYISGKLNGTEENYNFKTIKAKEIFISWDGTHVHADDEVVKISENSELQVRLEPGTLQFFER